VCTIFIRVPINCQYKLVITKYYDYHFSVISGRLSLDARHTRWRSGRRAKRGLGVFESFQDFFQITNNYDVLCKQLITKPYVSIPDYNRWNNSNNNNSRKVRCDRFFTVENWIFFSLCTSVN
jgi:hypothetical protein